MRIEFHYDHDAQGNIIGRHFIETDPTKPLGMLPPVGANPAVSQVSVIQALHANPALLVGSGWDLPTSHPTYPGQTRMQALIGEIIRLNDAPTRTLFGV